MVIPILHHLSTDRLSDSWEMGKGGGMGEMGDGVGVRGLGGGGGGQVRECTAAACFCAS